MYLPTYLPAAAGSGVDQLVENNIKRASNDDDDIHPIQSKSFSSKVFC